MSEKRPTYIQLMSPKLENVVSVLTDAKGQERSWAEYAKDCGINPSTMSRIINGKLKSALSVKTLDKLYAHRAESCELSRESFLLANGWIDKDKQRDMIDQHMAEHDKVDQIFDSMEQTIVRGFYKRGIPFTRLDDVAGIEEDNEEGLKLFDGMDGMLLQVGEVGKSISCAFEIIPIKLDKDASSSKQIVQRCVRLAVENYATIFLKDAWHLDKLLTDRVTFVFIDRFLYKAFWESFKNRRLNHFFTALLIDIDETEVTEERPLGDQASKTFSSLFDAPIVERPGRRFGEQISMFTGEQ